MPVSADRKTTAKIFFAKCAIHKPRCQNNFYEVLSADRTQLIVGKEKSIGIELARNVIGIDVNTKVYGPTGDSYLPNGFDYSAFTRPIGAGEDAETSC